MERHKITQDQAFALLVKASQHTNTRLRDVADEIVHSGRVPSAPEPRSLRGPDAPVLRRRVSAW